MHQYVRPRNGRPGRSDSDLRRGALETHNAPTSIGMYPGTFDPVHYGHIDIATRAAGLFHHVVVAVLDLPRKPLLMSLEERIHLFREGVQSFSNISVVGYEGLTVEFAQERGAVALVRGLRATSDFEYEYQMTTMNRHLRPGLETVFMMTSLKYAYLSSSLIKEVASLGAALEGLVPPHVAEALSAKFRPQMSAGAEPQRPA